MGQLLANWSLTGFETSLSDLSLSGGDTLLVIRGNCEYFFIMPALMGRSYSGIQTGHRLSGIRQFPADRWGGILALHAMPFL